MTVLDDLERALEVSGMNAGRIRRAAESLGFKFEGQSVDYFCRMFAGVVDCSIEIDVYWRQHAGRMCEVFTDVATDVYAPVIRRFISVLSNTAAEVVHGECSVFDTSRSYRWCYSKEHK